MKMSPTTQERLWAVISHLSALGFGMGILLPIVGWSEQRRKSSYASFQCLQALGYQSLGYTLWLLSCLLIGIVLILALAFAAGKTPDNSPGANTIAGIWLIIFMITFFGMFGIYFLLPISAAVACAYGKDFRYPILGNRLAKYLGYGQTNDESMQLIEEHEDRWVAAMSHISVIIALWGILAPLAAWILQGKRSLFVKFQSIQTTVYQAFVNILYIGAGFVYLVGMIVLFALAGLERGPYQGSPTSMAGLFVFGLSMLFASLIILILPLFHILGQWAGYRVLKDDDYHYPIVGKFVESWIHKQSTLNSDSGLSLKGKST